MNRVMQRPTCEQGMSYVALLLLIAMMGAVLASTATVYSQAAARAREAQLLWVGSEFRDAIGLYYLRSPGTVRTYPPALEDLLEDRRYLSLQRYLRRIYADPVTGETKWGLVTAPGGGIMGVYSLSGATPINRASFPEEFAHFRDAKTYRDWAFVWLPPAAPAAGPNSPAPRPGLGGAAK